ncbi:MAG: AAA family ATPase [Actinomycetota bacterium]|nr:AAA family ATPase [Actinomycetota bacterium]
MPEFEPLGERLRPKSLDEIVVGRKLIEPPSGPLYTIATANLPISVIIKGPPGCGKTTLARQLTRMVNCEVEYFTGSTFGVNDVKRIAEENDSNKRSLFRSRKIIVLDEIHRLTKVQQDSILEPLESGRIEVVGTTTESPYHSLARALVSRFDIFEVEQPSQEEVKLILGRAADHLNLTIEDELLEMMVGRINGDVRQGLRILSYTEELKNKNDSQTLREFIESFRSNATFIDQNLHYDLASKLIKAMRASNERVALATLAEAIDLGEDPKFIARRLAIFASEDISIADNTALSLAVSALTACESIGMPEIRIILGHVVLAFSRSPKSRESYDLYNELAQHHRQT